RTIFKKEFPEIAAFSPTASHHILLRFDNSSDDAPSVAMIKGIEPYTEQLTSSLSKKIIKTLPSATTYPELFINDYILIGKQLAQNNQISIGDQVELLFIREDHIRGRKITFDSQQARISGI